MLPSITHCLLPLWLTLFPKIIYSDESQPDRSNISNYVIGILSSQTQDPYLDSSGSTFETSFLRNGMQEYEQISSSNAMIRYLLKDVLKFDSVIRNKKTNEFSTNAGGITILIRNVPLNYSCSAVDILKAVQDTKDDIDAYILGEPFEECTQRTSDTSQVVKHNLYCSAIDIVAKLHNKICISWSCIPKTAPREDPSYSTSVIPAASLTADATISVLQKFGWKNVVLFSAMDTEPWNTLCSELQTRLVEKSEFSLRHYREISSSRWRMDTKDSHFNATALTQNWIELENLRYKAIILCLPSSKASKQSEGENWNIVNEILYSLRLHLGEKLFQKAVIWTDPIGRYVAEDVVNRFNENISHTNPTESRTPREKRIVPDPAVISHVVKIKLPSQLNKDEEHVSADSNFSNDIQPKSSLLNEENLVGDSKEKRNYRNYRNRFDRSIHDKGDWMTTDSNTRNTEKVDWLYHNTIIVSPVSYGFQLQNGFHTFLQKEKLMLMDNGVSPLHAYLAKAVLLTILSVRKLATTTAQIKSKDATLQIIRAVQESQDHEEKADMPSTSTTRFVIWNFLSTSTDNQTTTKIVPVVEMTLDKNMENFTFKSLELDGKVWFNGKPPERDSDCDENDILCQVSSTSVRVTDFLVIFLGVIVAIVLTNGIYKCFRRKKEMNDFKCSNKLFLSQEDLNLIDGGFPSSQIGRVKRRSQSADYSPCLSRLGSTVTLTSHFIGKSVDDNVLASFDGEIVFIKRLAIVPPPDNWKATKDVLRMLRDIRHENICNFFGLYCGSVLQGIVVEYCARRSLRELIMNRDYKLDLTFKVSLIHDLVKGMKYIHGSSLKCHGRLKSSNCVVDSRFVLKVSDYGVNRIYNALGRKNPSADATQTSADLLWTAPELLLDDELRCIGTQKGDSYSFAIICQEVFLRGSPYCTMEMSNEEIIRSLKNAPPTIRPVIPPDAAPVEIVQIMKQCWQQQPELRLTFSVVNAELKRMNRGNKHNIVENMMKQLEEYSGHLEDLVTERTAELDEEKKKTEKLLMRMLPPSAAKMLMVNESVVPETFQECTIYFSDICGFTTISLASTPMQVVDLLNDLYTCFDAIIEKYDVYKVETIGDAYMVSSGIPNRIGDRHAPEAAMMSLDIMSKTTTFKISHLPDVSLRIRIGLHSGSAVAGVVGLTMPRYCLFGDTINTASRLESTGIPSRIHVSNTTRNSLVESNQGFMLEKRGDIELKGRGKMTTWWLKGKEGYDIPLPTPGTVDGPSHGINLESIKKMQSMVSDVSNTNQNSSKPKPPPDQTQSNDGLKDQEDVVKKVNTNNNNNSKSLFFHESRKGTLINSTRTRFFGAKKTSSVNPQFVEQDTRLVLPPKHVRTVHWNSDL